MKNLSGLLLVVALLPCLAFPQAKPANSGWTIKVDGKSYPIKMISGVGSSSEIITPSIMGSSPTPGPKFFSHLVVRHVYDGTTTFFDWRTDVENLKMGSLKDVLLNYTSEDQKTSVDVQVFRSWPVRYSLVTSNPTGNIPLTEEIEFVVGAEKIAFTTSNPATH